MKRWRRRVFHVIGEQGKHHIEVPTVEGIASTIESGLKNAAAKGSRQAAQDSRGKRRHSRGTDFQTVGEWARAGCHE